jgi:hypothetical protein
MNVPSGIFAGSVLHSHFTLRLELFQPLKQMLGRLLSVALRIILGPAPKVVARVFHRAFRLPAELLVGPRGVRGEIEDIAGPSLDDLVWQIAADRFGEGLDHLKDGRPAASAQIPGADTGLLGAEIVEGCKVALCEIQDVNIVADSRAVVGFVVYNVAC